MSETSFIIEDPIMSEDDKPIKRDGKQQGVYYSKWDKFSQDANKDLDETDKKEKEESDAAPGLNTGAPKSEAIRYIMPE